MSPFEGGGYVAPMGRYTKGYNAVLKAKRAGSTASLRLARDLRVDIETSLGGITIQTIVESPLSSRIWRDFHTVCRRLDRRR